MCSTPGQNHFNCRSQQRKLFICSGVATLFRHKKMGFLKFYSLFLLRLPFNWRTPLAYFLTMAIQALQYLFSFATHVNGVALFLAICKIIGTFCVDFEQELNNLNKVLDKFKGATNDSVDDVRLEVKQSLKHIIQFQCDVKR